MSTEVYAFSLHPGDVIFVQLACPWIFCLHKETLTYPSKNIRRMFAVFTFWIILSDLLFGKILFLTSLAFIDVCGV
jgi:hypothetical protein